MFIDHDEVFPAKSGQSVLESVQVTPSDDVCALRFAYYQVDGLLTIEMSGKVVRTLPSTSLDGLFADWDVEVVSFKASVPSVLQFVMSWSTTDAFVEVGLDDIQFISCSCE